MIKRYFPTFLLIWALGFGIGRTQELRLQKGVVIDSVVVNDSITNSFSLYLPTSFEVKGKWPLLIVFDMEGKGKQALGMFKDAAEKRGYILASPNSVNDTLGITKNMVSTKLVLQKVNALFPIHKGRIYTAGYGTAGRFANLAPIFLKEIEGVVTAGASLANVELLSAKRPYHFVNVIGLTDFNYTTLLEDEKILNKLKFPNSLLLHENGPEWPGGKDLTKALLLFDLAAMAKKKIVLDTGLVARSFEEEKKEIRSLRENNKLLLAERQLREAMKTYRNLMDVTALKETHKQLKKDKLYRSFKRANDAALFKEALKREDYRYFLQEDVVTYNFKNLGWWNYQMSQINTFIYGDSRAEQHMGKRLLGFLNALVEDNIELVKSETVVDEEALTFLWMLKTITASEVFENYFEVVSLSAKNDDYGTAIFYLEEVLKKGYKQKENVYSIPNTNLLRITPEFNALVKKYLNDARYDTIKE